MMKKYRKRTGGFTFVEIMIVLAVFIVIGGSLAYILSSGEEAWYMSDAGFAGRQKGDVRRDKRDPAKQPLGNNQLSG
jgi:hypothetical protein